MKRLLFVVICLSVTAEGQPLRPPMPPYRLNEADARAVAAYLKSLKSK